jgi:hypothetical protein
MSNILLNLIGSLYDDPNNSGYFCRCFTNLVALEHGVEKMEHLDATTYHLKDYHGWVISVTVNNNSHHTFIAAAKGQEVIQITSAKGELMFTHNDEYVLVYKSMDSSLHKALRKAN